LIDCPSNSNSVYVFIEVVVYFRAFCVGGEDKSTHVYGAEKFENLIIYSMGGHLDVIVGSFFENDSLDVSLTDY